MKTYLLYQRAILALALIVTLTFDACDHTEELNPSEDYMVYDANEGVIGKGGGKIQISDPQSPIKNAFIEVPANALSAEANFSITPADNSYAFEDKSENIFVSFEPSGIKFDSPIYIGIPYNTKENPDTLQPLYYDEKEYAWKPFFKSTIDRDKKVIVAQTNHFTVGTASKSGVNFDFDLYKNENDVYAKVWLTTPLNCLPTSPSCFVSTGYTNIRQLLMADKEVRAFYKVVLKEKVNSWFSADKEVTSKFIIYDVFSYSLNDPLREVRVMDRSENVLFETGWIDYQKVEMFYSGRPYLIHFPNTLLNSSKEYYLETTLYFVNSSGLIDNSGGLWGTHGYYSSSVESPKYPSEMVLPNDADGDCITDPFDLVYGAIPHSPSTPFPSDKSTNVPVSVLLTWEGSDPDGDPLTYDIYLSSNSNPSSIVSTNQSSNSYQCNNLLGNTMYYWKVVAKDNHGNSNTSSVWSFRTLQTGSAPISNFTVDNRTIPVGGTVTFSDQSTNNPTSWSWNFGDGQTSNLPSPAHTYASAGTYTVTLTASNSIGSDGETKVGYITVNPTSPAPVANFSSSGTTITAGGFVQFFDQSTNNPTSWSWNFGDGQTMIARNPAHTYTTVGSFTVTLTASNINGSDVETKVGYITVNPAGYAPVANFTVDNRTIKAGETVTFTDQSTNNPTSWSWNFGDEMTSTSRNPSHTYTTAGTYTITLTSSNSFGSDGETRVGYITVNPAGSGPVANFTVDFRTITVGETVTFTDQSTNNPTSWSWNFGDGQTSNLPSPAHTYASAGTYTVTLTASNSIGSDGETKVDYIIVNLAGSPPVANFTALPTRITVGGTITFNDQSTNNPTSWSWNFGDDHTSSLPSPTHTFSSVGTYTITLIVSNINGSHEAVLTDYITINPLPSPDIIFNPNRTYGTLSDVDGNTYRTIQIGNQTWMAENLKTTKYNDNSSIPQITDLIEWTNLSSPAYCWFDNNINYKETYGALYNWYVVSPSANGGKNVCPINWHVSTDEEIYILLDNFGGAFYAPNMLKERGTSHWEVSTSDVTNESGFTALPSGARNKNIFNNNAFFGSGGELSLWSSTEYDDNSSWFRSIPSSGGSARWYLDKKFGHSIRCVKD